MGGDKKVLKVEGHGVPLRGDDIDTDQILPARFLKETSFENMGEYVFYDARRDSNGELNNHPFNQYEGEILVVNDNFGCGSSREHAPQGLMRWGIEGIIGESFAEIFQDNCKSLGIPTATVDHETASRLQDKLEEDPETEIRIKVEEEKAVINGEKEIDIDIDRSMKEALTEGIWDTTALMKSSMDQVRKVYNQLPYTET
ncbi:MAG: 3-isopropylmalate dehydratase small subunit 2 [Candidatus Nanohalobium sp.]